MLIIYFLELWSYRLLSGFPGSESIFVCVYCCLEENYSYWKYLVRSCNVPILRKLVVFCFFRQNTLQHKYGIILKVQLYLFVYVIDKHLLLYFRNVVHAWGLNELNLNNNKNNRFTEHVVRNWPPWRRFPYQVAEFPYQHQEGRMWTMGIQTSWCWRHHQDGPRLCQIRSLEVVSAVHIIITITVYLVEKKIVFSCVTFYWTMRHPLRIMPNYLALSSSNCNSTMFFF